LHETHAPLLHTRFAPHDVPSVTAVIEFVHVATPSVHAVTLPLSQGALGGVQTAPTVHALHTPP
jgi:hypothetical protein